MFSSALKSITSSNINSNYTISPTPTSFAGPWKIHDAKKKSTGKPHSVFVFDKKSLEAHASSVGGGGRSGGGGGYSSSSSSSSSSSASFKRSVEEVVERLKKEASSLAKLRHPNILELVEPVEETRGGGLQFVTEAVTASLAGLLLEKDEQERSGGRGSSHYVTEDLADDGGARRRRRRREMEIEIDELEIQKGLLQISRALEFLHENAGLVHGNLTPDAVLINAKSDWKISGLAFCSPAEGSAKPSTSSIQAISLAEALNIDPRLPRSVQLDLDFTSPDFVLDSNLTPAADMFSLGLLSVALYNSPHHSPLHLESHGSNSISTYKRAFSSPASIPTPSNNFLSARPLPKDLAQHVLPRLIARRPAQRMTAREFQASEYFDNILVSTIRFLDAFPAKTPQEKSQFLRGLVKVLPSFPRSVMEKKLLPALLDEMKDRPLLSLILQNVFKIVSLLPSARRAFGDRIRPALKAVFVENAKQQNQDKDPARDAGLMVFLEQISIVADHCNGKEFKEDILPIILAAIECPTPSIVDVALRSLPLVLPVLDFSTIKNELFPIVCTVFSKTSSLAIKVRGLEAFVVLCGGSLTPASTSTSTSIPDESGLDGLSAESTTTKNKSSSSSSSSSSALDKYTMQEKIVPLIKAIKTKEPAVMMAARDLMLVIGQTADAEFVAMDILPILWTMSLGPLLNLKQFQAFMDLVRTLSKRVEDEQTRKLHELAGTSAGGLGATSAANDDFLAFGGVSGTAFDATASNEDDFETLVKGRASSPGSIGNSNGNSNGNATFNWIDTTSKASTPLSLAAAAPSPSFSWSTPPPAQAAPTSKTRPAFRTASPETSTSRFEALTPSATQFSQPLRPSTHPSSSITPASPPSINWSSSATSRSQASSPPAAAPQYSSFHAPAPAPSSFSLAPPPSAPRQTGWASPAMSLGSLGGSNSMSMNKNSSMGTKMSVGTGMSMAGQGQAKSGLDKYESLI